jgi:hypothetical protein
MPPPFGHYRSEIERLVSRIATAEPGIPVDPLPFLRGELSQYATSCQMTGRHELPLTSNGKVDRAELIREYAENV